MRCVSIRFFLFFYGQYINRLDDPPVEVRVFVHEVPAWANRDEKYVACVTEVK